MSAKLDDAKVKLKRADRYLKLSITLFVVFMIGATGLVSYQLYELQRGLYSQQEQSEERAKEDRQEAQRRLERALADNERLHRQTQAYVKCTASALIKPLAERSADVFDQCGIDTAGTAGKSTAAETPAVMPSAQPQPKNPGSNQPTTSSPPDPNKQAVDPPGPDQRLLDDTTQFFKDTTTGISNLLGVRSTRDS